MALCGQYQSGGLVHDYQMGTLEMGDRRFFQGDEGQVWFRSVRSEDIAGNDSFFADGFSIVCLNEYLEGR